MRTGKVVRINKWKPESEQEKEKEEQEQDEWKLFRLRQSVIYWDKESQLEIRQRDIFEGRNVAGNTTLIVVLRILPDWTYYLINKKNRNGKIEPMCQKVSSDDFIRLVESGELWLVDHAKVDYERFSLGFIMAESFLNGFSLEEKIAVDEQAMMDHVIGRN